MILTSFENFVANPNICLVNPKFWSLFLYLELEGSLHTRKGLPNLVFTSTNWVYGVRECLPYSVQLIGEIARVQTHLQNKHSVYKQEPHKTLNIVLLSNSTFFSLNWKVSNKTLIGKTGVAGIVIKAFYLYNNWSVMWYSSSQLLNNLIFL